MCKGLDHDRIKKKQRKQENMIHPLLGVVIQAIHHTSRRHIIIASESGIKKRRKKEIEKKKLRIFFMQFFIPEESGLLSVVHARVLTTLVTFSASPIGVAIIEEPSRCFQYRLNPTPAANEAKSNAGALGHPSGFHRERFQTLYSV